LPSTGFRIRGISPGTVLPALIRVEPVETGHFGLPANPAATRIACLLTAPSAGLG